MSAIPPAALFPSLTIGRRRSANPVSSAVAGFGDTPSFTLALFVGGGVGSLAMVYSLASLLGLLPKFHHFHVPMPL